MPQIVRFYEYGGPEVLRIEESPLQDPANGEVRLRVQAIGLNRAESMFFHNQYVEQPQLPSRLGYEAAGVVDAVGTDAFTRRSQRPSPSGKLSKPIAIWNPTRK